MVSINIGAGQGITQAIATKLGLKGQDLKKISLSTWQNVMTEVNNAQSQIDKHNASTQNDKQKSIFTGGRDVNAINQKSNFVVQQGSVEINESSWNKIVQLLTGQSSEIKSNNKEVTFDGGELAEVTVTGKAPDLIKKVDYSPNMDIEQLEISGLDIPQSNSENIIDLEGSVHLGKGTLNSLDVTNSVDINTLSEEEQAIIEQNIMNILERFGISEDVTL